MPHSKYSLFVKVMKLALPMGGFFILAIALAWPYLSQKDVEPSTYVDSSSPAIVENRMIRPKYAGTDKKGQPFEVEADWGKPTTDHEADLITPHGTLTTEKHGDVHLDAKHGHYDKDSRQLVLEGQVTLNTEDGYNFVTQKADIDVNQKTVTGDLPVKGHGPAGKMQAQDGFLLRESKEGGRVLVLRGPSRVTINAEVLKKVKSR